MSGTRASTLWLLGNDLRLARRELRLGSPWQKLIIGAVLLGVIVSLHLVGFAAAPQLAQLHAVSDNGLPVVTVMLIGVSALCLSKAISGMIDSMRDQGDLELLVTSPLPPRVVLRARLIAIGLGAGGLPFVAAIPVVNGMMLRGHFDWVGVYPVLGSVAIIAAIAAACAFLGLLAVIGPKRARLAARVIATVLGALAFLASQTTTILPADRREALWQLIKPLDSAHPSGIAWLPARAMYGDFGAMLLLCAAAFAGVMLTSAAFERSYGTGAIAILNADRGGRAVRAANFGAGLTRVLITKEIRNFMRQPGLLIQIVYQFIFLIPAAIAVTRFTSGVSASGGVLFITVMMTGRIASVFLDVVVRNDRALELVMSAPIDRGLVFRVKTGLLSLAVFVVTAPLLVIVALRIPHAFPVVLAATLGSVMTRFVMELRKPHVIRFVALRGRLHVSSASLLGAMADVAWAMAGALVLVRLHV